MCLRRVAAERIAEGDAVYLRKSCPEHGVSKTVIWRGLASYAAWGGGPRTASPPAVCGSAVERGCPYDCGLCPDHRQQHTLLRGRCWMLRHWCNLAACPVCFASANSSACTRSEHRRNREADEVPCPAGDDERARGNHTFRGWRADGAPRPARDNSQNSSARLHLHPAQHQRSAAVTRSRVRGRAEGSRAELRVFAV